MIAYKLDAGFDTENDTAVPGGPAFTRLGAPTTVGRPVFIASTGAAIGMRNNMLERARIASIVPELNFVRYAFVGVFILFSAFAS